ncbi:MAG TPA: flagellar biosynthesis anti-sigma factor FlgM [Candidatus Binatia bacterium]|jgi:anti-sigma28 factor (negative regulator of flagellin synthesis)
MKITEKGPADVDLSELMQNDKVVGSVRREEDAKVRQDGESAKVDIFSKARKLQRVTELACKGDQLRADRVRQIKKQIKTDQHQVDSKEVAKSIVRSEVSRLLDKKK